MRNIAILFLISGLAIAQTTKTSPAAGESDDTGAVEATTSTVDLLPNIPPLPKGNTTLIGGTLINVDRVQDLLEVQPFGGRRMEVQFDERTSIYRDGQKVSPRDLKVGSRAYLDTMSDGDQVFARSIHLRSGQGSGEIVGQVQSYEANRGRLTLHDALSPEPVELHVSSATAVTGKDGGASLADLRPGALVEATFSSDRNGNGVAHAIKILALPGRAFMFSGRIAYLDLRTSVLALVDPRDQKTYEVHFTPATRRDLAKLHEGDNVMVVARFNGTRYEASSVTINSIPGKN